MQQWSLQDKGVLSTKVINIKNIIIYTAVSLFIITLSVSVFSILHKTQRIEKRIINEFGNTNDKLENLQMNSIRISEDLNQTRGFLGLPESSYSFNIISDENENHEGNSSNTELLPFYKGFEYLKNHYTELGLQKNLAVILETADFKKVLEEKSLNLVEIDKLYRIAETGSGNIFFEITIDVVNKSVFVTSPVSDIEPELFETVSLEKLVNYIDSKYDKIKNHNEKYSEFKSLLAGLLSDSKIKAYLKSNKLYLEKSENVSKNTIIDIKRESGIKIAEINLSYENNLFLFCGEKYTDFNKLRENILNITNICDIRTFDEKKIEKSISEIKELSVDESFVKYLSDNGYCFSDKIREDNDYYYFDIILKGQNSKIGSFSVHKISGEIYITDYEEVPVSSLETVSELSKKKN